MSSSRELNGSVTSPIPDQIYAKALKSFTRTTKRAFEASTAAKGIDAGNQRYWASVLLTRICSLCTSVLLVCPRSVLNERGLNWDFEGVAALSRSLFEAILMLFYLGLETVSEDEWKARIKLVHLADCTERIRLFHSLENQDEIASFVLTAVGLRSELKANSFFQTIPLKKQKELLTGEKATLFGKGEIITRLKENPEATLDFYRFISNYVHSFPLGFHRTSMHKRDGTENDVDKTYMGLALEFATEWLLKGVEAFEFSFADLVIFGQRSFDFRILMSQASSLSARDEALIQNVFAPRQRGL